MGENKMKTLHDTKELTITRTFDASQELLWRAWTDPEFLKRWWGPKDFTTPYARIDLRIGGKYLNCMRSPDGKDYWSTGTYKEIIPMKKIVCTDSFADNQGNVISAALYSMNPDFPPEMLVTVDFKDFYGKTVLTITHEGLPDSEKEMCAQGWNESLDKLDKLLSTQHSEP